MVNYFENCNTVESTKAHYRDLAFKYHPDRNPGIDIEIIKTINNQYKENLKELGFFWNSTRLLWYYRPESQKAYYKSTRSLDDIAKSYGAAKIIKDEKSKVKKLGK